MDNTFNNDGWVSTDLGCNDEFVSAIQIQPDGKIVAIGATGYYDLALIARYNNNGTPDSTFGNFGKITHSFPNYFIGADGAVQNDGKIILVGGSYNGPNNDFIVVRFNNNGSVDNSFNDSGIVITDFGANDWANSIVLQPDGKILVAGFSENSQYNFCIARYKPDGTMDSTFNDTGKMIFYYSDLFWDNSIAVQPDGKILAVGSSSWYTNSDIAVVRFNNNGTLDSAFNGDGLVSTDFGNGGDYGTSLAIQNDGKIIVSGYAQISADTVIALVRYNSDGTLDSTFGSDGIVTAEVGNKVDFSYSVALQSNQKIVISGIAFISGCYRMIAGRYNSDGSLDFNFGDNGWIISDINGGTAFRNSIAVQADGKIVVGTASYNGTNFDFGLVRYMGDTVTNIHGLTKSENININIFPNPSCKEARLHYQLKANEKGALVIMNVLGSIVAQYDLPAGKKEIVISTGNFKKGIYFYSVKVNGKVVIADKLVVIH